MVLGKWEWTECENLQNVNLEMQGFGEKHPGGLGESEGGFERGGKCGGNVKSWKIPNMTSERESKKKTIDIY